MKSIWTVAALIAVVAVPFLIARKPERKVSAPIAADANDIFEWEQAA